MEAIEGITSGKAQNRNLRIYTQSMSEVAAANKILFIDCFAPSLNWYQNGNRYTIDGALYNDHGYKKLGEFLADSIFPEKKSKDSLKKQVHQAVMDKNFF